MQVDTTINKIKIVNDTHKDFSLSMNDSTVTLESDSKQISIDKSIFNLACTWYTNMELNNNLGMAPKVKEDNEDTYVCPICSELLLVDLNTLFTEDYPRFCSKCGQKIKWN